MKPSASTPVRRVRLLMLHGWTQNGPLFREKSRGFERKLNQAGVELVFANGPVAVPASAALPGSTVAERVDPRGWWTYPAASAEERDAAAEAAESSADSDLCTRTDATSLATTLADVKVTDEADLHAAPAVLDLARFRREYEGWPLSRAAIAELWGTVGPFDGICGFSQGAVVVHQLLRELEDDPCTLHPDMAPIAALPPRFAIFVCGFEARHGGAGVPPGTILRTPSLHVVGENDSVVPAVLQRELAACFAVHTVVACDKGHAMPQRAGDLAAVTAFVGAHRLGPGSSSVNNRRAS